MGFDWAGGRLVELGQRQRRAQFEAARSLLLRDGDGGQEGFFRRRGVGGVALQQDFAARPMQFRFERAIADAIARRQRFVEDRIGAVVITRLGLGLSQRNLNNPSNIRTFCSRRSSTPRRMSSSPGPERRFRRRPALKEHAKRMKHWKVALARDISEFDDVRAARARWPRINSNKAACVFPIP